LLQNLLQRSIILTMLICKVLIPRKVLIKMTDVNNADENKGVFDRSFVAHGVKGHECLPDICPSIKQDISNKDFSRDQNFTNKNGQNCTPLKKDLKKDLNKDFSTDKIFDQVMKERSSIPTTLDNDIQSLPEGTKDNFTTILEQGNISQTNQQHACQGQNCTECSTFIQKEKNISQEQNNTEGNTADKYNMATKTYNSSTEEQKEKNISQEQKSTEFNTADKYNMETKNCNTSAEDPKHICDGQNCYQCHTFYKKSEHICTGDDCAKCYPNKNTFPINQNQSSIFTGEQNKKEKKQVQNIDVNKAKPQTL